METKYQQSVFEAQIDKSTVEQTRKISFILAAESTDRDHRNKFLYNWDNWGLSNFNANPIVGYQHNVYGDNMCLAPNPDDVIGKATAGIDTYRGKRAIVAETTFEPADLNATADKVFRKVLWGSLNAVSVGVNPIGKVSTITERNGKNEIVDAFLKMDDGQDLVEFSIVNIPADPMALKRSLKSHTMAALNFIQKSIPELSLNDLKGMKVQDILDLYERKNGENVAQLELELVGADPNLDKYTERLTTIQNNRKWTL